MRCRYRSPRRKSSVLALRSTSACKTGRNLPLSTIDGECLDLANPDVSSNQREAKGFSPATDVPPAADESVGDGFPPQGLTAATPFARNRDTLVPDGAKTGSLREQTPAALLTVLTTSFLWTHLNRPPHRRRKTRRPCPGGSFSNDRPRRKLPHLGPLIWGPCRTSSSSGIADAKRPLQLSGMRKIAVPRGSRPGNSRCV